MLSKNNIIGKCFHYLINSDYRFAVRGQSFGMYHDMEDKEYLQRVFKGMMGYELNLDNPVTFNEKMQWLKLYDRKPIFTLMVDKYEVKRIVANIIGEKYIIPTIGVWASVEDIEWEALPKQFVIKCNHDSGSVSVCRDKEKIDKRAIIQKLKKCLNRNLFFYGREWPYKNVKPLIIAEKYLEEKLDCSAIRASNKGLTDYKFFCFNGVPEVLYVSKGLEHHPTAEISFYDLNGHELNYHRSDFKPYHNAVMPVNFDEMKVIAAKIAENVPCPFVRIDLYSISNHVYFSEITFTPCSGLLPFEPAEADLELGNKLRLPLK